MNQRIRRRDFLTGSIAAGVAISTSSEAAASTARDSRTQEFYELRVYQNTDTAKQQAVLEFVEQALRPALHRQGTDRIGTFKPDNSDDASIYLVIPYTSLEQLALQNDRLEEDAAYHEAAAEYFARPQDDAAFARVESRLMRAFAGMPTLEAPPNKSARRILELRIYESHNERLAKLKVEMFNQGEIDIMRDVGLAPVFFGETLISSDVPNLTYMLSADSKQAHKEHWDAFMKHPDWHRMKNMARYKGTVSKIVSVTLTPTAGSPV